uniref:PGG domain-containing protein n=1 Tax=Salix viminalis TaxID=40686 RepID=A0A6N2NKL5_SALVM
MAMTFLVGLVLFSLKARHEWDACDPTRLTLLADHQNVTTNKIKMYNTQSFMLKQPSISRNKKQRWHLSCPGVATQIPGIVNQDPDFKGVTSWDQECWYLLHIFARVKMSRPSKGSDIWFKKFRYDKSKDSPREARNVLLVVVALIAAATFQAGVNPPGGVWQEGDHAGRAIYASHKRAFYVFLITNTLALSTCILVIVSLTYRFPFHFEILAASGLMMITYASAVFAVIPHETVHARYVLIPALVPVLIRCLSYFFKKYCKVENESQIGSQEEGEEHDGQAGDQQV